MTSQSILLANGGEFKTNAVKVKYSLVPPIYVTLLSKIGGCGSRMSTVVSDFILSFARFCTLALSFAAGVAMKLHLPWRSIFSVRIELKASEV